MNTIIDWGAPLAAYMLSSGTPAKKTTSEFLDSLRKARLDQVESLLKEENFEDLKNALFELVGHLKHPDLPLFEKLLKHLDQHHKIAVNLHTTNIDVLIKDLEEKASNQPEILAILRESQSLDVDEKRGDVKFCIQLENPQNVEELVQSASDFQIQSALIFFCSDNARIPSDDQFISLMQKLVVCAKNRKIALSFARTLLCQKISVYSFRDDAINLLDLLITDDEEPVKMDDSNDWVIIDPE